MHRVGVENHQMNIIQRTKKKEERNRLRYPDTGASVETDSRLRSVRDCTIGEPSEALIRSAATERTHTKGNRPLPVNAFSIKHLIDRRCIEIRISKNDMWPNNKYFYSICAVTTFYNTLHHSRKQKNEFTLFQTHQFRKPKILTLLCLFQSPIENPIKTTDRKR